ncbi:ABC transporter ATP-binding protein [Clostridium botulinum]|uniref:ABC transporter n=1 Tax=Clostridium botulinum C/D str. DC5 TaxID=1443128 RepID=A0A0A0ICG7_CLOBO|nr:ABC transporter ATP-binding protein [Clostridium botulinum]KEI04404.1 ABC transporter [Clostridium botulinum C/D str. BKT75002]KEI11313.1 ABC transporter [Clostridium botulinum C/D str. BKT2873]KGM99149.1 ABC transporter [Clostridium botulinum C/D str. DC5]KOC52697.1 ABC transporter [Clostridium botulinum]KOC53169.1 ABC transporter [Clostridium botulinum]
MNKETILHIKGLKMSFGSKEVLKGINLEVKKGEIIGYIGPNGAGKTTTVKIILGLLKGYQGNIEIFGEKICENDIEYKKRIGYVPEVADFYDVLTAKEYLTFIGELYGLDYEKTLSRSEKLMEILGIGNMFNTRLCSYSKGMRQKVSIIASLLHNPDILFLDEPLSGLDANSVMIIKEVLSLLASQGKTIFYSSHIMDVVEKISSRIVLLNDGNIVADGTFEELKKSSSENSLENIFNDLTGFTNHKSIAESFTSIIEEVK